MGEVLQLIGQCLKEENGSGRNNFHKIINNIKVLVADKIEDKKKIER